jgi:hypothetical protein
MGSRSACVHACALTSVVHSRRQCWEKLPGCLKGDEVKSLDLGWHRSQGQLSLSTDQQEGFSRFIQNPWTERMPQNHCQDSLF